MSEYTELERNWLKHLFGVRVSIHYHTLRRAFFDWCHSAYTFVTLVLSSAAFAALLHASESADDVAIVLAVFVSVISALNLVARPSEKGRMHHDFVRRFTEVEQDMVAIEHPTAEDLAVMRRRRLTIEADEPPPKKYVCALAHNEVVRAMGDELDEKVPIPRVGRLLAHLTNIGSSSLDKARRLNPVHP